MKKVYKRISLFLVFIVTLVTCSGCLSLGENVAAKRGEVSLVTTPASTTMRFMNEALYLGYLGAQRDFALIVDNGQYAKDRSLQGCGVEQSNGDIIGCSSTLTKLVMNYGIKASYFTNISGAENLLLYYITSSDFDKIGSDQNTWFGRLTSSDSEVDFDDSLQELSCGYNKVKHPEICTYSSQMSQKGYSDKAGNSMIILYNNGSLNSVITDNSLDPNKTLNKGNMDNLIYDNNNQTQIKNHENYYNNILKSLEGKINVSHATNMAATNTGTVQSIQNIDTISELEALISGNKGVDDFLLLITSDGFIEDKIGTNYNYNNSVVDEYDSDDEEFKKLSLLYNSVSTYTDNCAVESEPLLNFLKGVLQAYLTGSLFSMGGALAGAAAGALIGSIIPGVGTAIGAAVGALAGALAGWIAGISLAQDIEDMLNSNNGISDKSYCKIMETALKDVQINVPIYSYHISKASDNIKAYKNGNLDSKLTEYYNTNENKCLNQSVEIAVPSGVISFLTSALDKKYAYADTCEKDLVSKIVKGFTGSPSLLLFLNGKKADDLNGRVTTELTLEMLNVWGLQTIGSLYTLSTSSKLNDMSFTFASAQAVSDIKYCVSTNSLPSCDNLTTTPVTLNSSYINALAKENGITINATNIYKQYSREHISEKLYASRINGAVLDVAETSQGNQEIYVHNDEWIKEEILFGNDLAPFNAILDKVKESLSTQLNGNMYLVNKNGFTYAICDNGDIVGFKIVNNSLKISYFYDNDGNEYIFDSRLSRMDVSINDVAKEHLLKEVLYESSVDSAHDFYIYVKYTVDSRVSYYTYVI